MERQARCLINGELVAETEARICALDRGFLYADGVFETLRVYAGEPFRLARHWRRLESSADFLAIPAPRPEAEQWVAAVLDANRLREGTIRITLSRGPLPAGPRPNGATPEPTLLVQARPLRSDLDQVQQHGLTGQLTPWPTRAQGCPLHQHKTLAYLSSILALGHTAPGREPLLWNAHGNLAEGATSNLFWVDDGTLFTPSIEAGCLPGVTRELVLELARRAGLAVREGLFPRAALAAADEALVTNSVLEVAPLVALDEQPLGAGTPGPVTRALQRAYRHAVEQEATPR